jgi:hypothetical protein
LETDVCILKYCLIIFGEFMFFKMFFQNKRLPGWILPSLCLLVLFTLSLAPIGISAADQRREADRCFQNITIVPDLATKPERSQGSLDKLSSQPVYLTLPRPETFLSLDPVGHLFLPEHPITPKAASSLEPFFPRPPPA